MSAPAEEVIVAGARAMDAYWGGRYAPDEVEELRGEITAIVEAVAPFIKAQALEEAADSVMGPSDVLVDAATCRWIAMELRERAAAVRGKS